MESSKTTAASTLGPFSCANFRLQRSPAATHADQLLHPFSNRLACHSDSCAMRVWSRPACQKHEDRSMVRMLNHKVSHYYSRNAERSRETWTDLLNAASPWEWWRQRHAVAWQRSKQRVSSPGLAPLTPPTSPPFMQCTPPEHSKRPTFVQRVMKITWERTTRDTNFNEMGALVPLVLG